MKFLAAFMLVLALLVSSSCKKTEEQSLVEVITLQLSLEAGFPNKEAISEVIVILDARDPSAQVVFRAAGARAGAIGGLPVRWEHKDYDGDQAMEQVITISGNPFRGSTFFMVGVLPEVMAELAVAVKVSVILKDNKGDSLGWGFACDNHGQDIYLGVRQIVGVPIKSTRRDPCPPCTYMACDEYGNCAFDYDCAGECCECKEPCLGDGGVCGGDKTCVKGCCVSGGKDVGETCTGSSECTSGFCKDGKCCNTACTTPCNTCTTGACTEVKGREDDPECKGDSTCDAAGQCKRALGKDCLGGSECASGICKDGKCCNTECSGLCHTCKTGTCTPVMGESDVPECSGASTCDSSGFCKPREGRNCTSGVECASGYCKDGVCCDRACDNPCRQCRTGACTVVANGQDDPECAGSWSCSAAGACLKKYGEDCTGASECASGFCRDGKCCNSECAGACHNCATGVCLPVTLAQDHPECAGTQSCNEAGVCLKKEGQSCSGAEECASGFCREGKCCNTSCTTPCYTCLTGTCVKVAGQDDYPDCMGASTCDSTGLCKPRLGQACSSGTQCASGNCKDGVCCNEACEASCMSCVTGTCTGITNAEDAPECGGANICSAAGVCKKKNGQECTGGSACASGFCKDGKCCNTECSGMCLSCASGTCSAVLSQDDAPECTGINTCNGDSICRKKQAQACSGDEACASGHCKDGRCCDTSCTAACYSCESGTCTKITSRDDISECTAATTCDANGVCKPKLGQACSAGTQCASGFCKDGVCCNEACTGACRSCATGTCADIRNAEDDPECTGLNTCSAYGECRKKNGQSCMGGSECASGICKDGKCCNTECDGACLGCATGSCMAIKNAEDEPECTNEKICNESGSCRKKDGQSCTGDEECASIHCKDGKCCNTACTTACYNCETGTCLKVQNQNDYSECYGTNTCDANGLCRLKLGQSCTGGDECASGSGGHPGPAGQQPRRRPWRYIRAGFRPAAWLCPPQSCAAGAKAGRVGTRAAPRGGRSAG